MRTILPAMLLVLLAADPIATQEAKKKTATLQIELTDAETGRPLSGLVSVRDEDGKRVHLGGLLNRGIGVAESYSIHDWYLIAGPAKATVPRRRLRIKAFHGLESEFGEATVDLRGKESATVKIPLKRFYNAHSKGLQSANTHVHLQKISLKQSDRYLLDVARAEDLNLVYISYLERAVADLEYTTNKYTMKDLNRLSHQAQHHHHHGHGHHHHHHSHTEFDNGEEHRHNFTGFGQGYGHVMFLHLSELVQPVSIGPGISKKGTDGIPLRHGIEKARELGSTVIWCHNQWGLEDIPNWLSGKLQANNIFDGGTHGSYKHSFYRYLNAGLKVPFSTGTDWFIYDFSRVYVKAGKGKVGKGKYLTSEQWLKQLAAGRSYITNGPLLEFTVNGKPVGETIDLKQPGKLKISCRALGRMDFKRLELIRNGKVVRAAASQKEGGHYIAELKLDLPVDQPCWLALRTPPPSAGRDPEFQRKTPLNEYGRELFSHTSALYVNLSGQSVFQRDAARDLLDEMKENRKFIAGHALFGNAKERQQVLGIYDVAIQQMQGKIERAALDQQM